MTSPVAQVAQLVEHATENRSVGGSIPPLGTTSFEEIILASPTNGVARRLRMWGLLTGALESAPVRKPLLERGRVQDSACGPELVQAPGNAKPRL